ncbi:MAG: glycosyl hydrolase, partial [Bacteroidales bacterium]
SWQWNQDHGYMIWNLYAAAGGHLTGKRIISCEAMTNTRGVFKTSLEEIKQHDDMNFITGINHSVLHGFNYSPPEAGFPGWIRYGAYFSEQNPWWPYLHRWVEYNARLSFIFQHSRPRKSIAIMGPTGDLWSETGLVRQPFHTRPWYLHRLWQPISQAGYSCEYLNQRAMQDAEIVDGRIRYGPMSYRTLVLADVKSVHPGVARKIRQFVEEGGELVLIDRVPERSLHMTDSRKNDEMVREVFSALVGQYPHSVFRLSSPADRSMLNAWVYGWLEKLDLQPDVVIRVPDEDVYQIYQATETKDIYFFTNVHRKDTAMIHAIFPTGGRIPYLWDPESGERWRYPFQSDAAELDLVLPPLRSLLLVFEPDEKDLPVYPEFAPALKGTYMARVDRPDRRWTVKGEHVNGTTCRWEMTELKDLSTSPDSMKNSFAGRLIFSTQFENTENISHIHLGETHRGVTEVYVNGALAGVNWYGEPLFPVGPLLRPGNNDLEIRYTTVLANYCLELDDPVARRWTVYEEKVPCGLEGPVWLMRYENP